MTNADISSKTCFKCGNCLPRTEFYKHTFMADGLLGKCKTCAKSDVTANRLKNIEKIREYDKSRAKNAARIQATKEHNKRWRSEDRRRSACHSKVARALRSGLIEKTPCCVCGSAISLAHHESYDRPLDVVWYCQIHHKERHKQMVIHGIDP